MMTAQSPTERRGGRARLIRWMAVALVTLLALGLHLRAVSKLPIDFDENNYLLAAQHYSQALAAGDWHEIISWDFNFEHPPLTKLVYAAALLPLPPAPPIPELPVNGPAAESLPQPHFDVARTVSALLGTLEVLTLALVNPLAGFFLGINTWQLKYTSQVMLEPLPALTSALAVVLYLGWRRAGAGQQGWAGWLPLSALALGLTAASKYTYCIAGIAILIDWLCLTYPTNHGITPRALARWLAPVAGWGLLVIAVFVAADPRMWANGLDRLRESILYHASYAESAHVQDAGYPFWQPFVWLSGPVPWHPGVFIFMTDLYVSLLAVFGFGRLWQRQRVMAIWLVCALVFLSLWPTKWPQYILILTVPLSMAAAQGFGQRVWDPLATWLREFRATRGRRRPNPAFAPARWRDLRRALPWLLPGLAALLLIAVFPLVYQAAMALTNLSTNSLKDGLQGGIWREVWRGLTGQVQPVEVTLFGNGPPAATKVQYAGPAVLLQFFTGLASDILFFNIMWVVLSVGLQLGLGTGAALLLHRRGLRFAGWWRAVLLLPWAIPEFVGAVMWHRMFEPQFGWLRLGLPAQIPLPDFQKDQTFALVVMLIAATWYGFPLIMLAMSVSLKLLPAEVYDAAALDGASGWRQFRDVTWPMALPLMAPVLILRIIYAFNQFYLFYVINPPGSLYTFSSISFFFFNSNAGFGGQFAFSAALNIFTVVVLAVLILWFNRRTRAVEGVTYA